MKPPTLSTLLLLAITTTHVTASPQATGFSIAPEPTQFSIQKPFYKIHCTTHTGGKVASASEARVAAQALCYDSVHDRPDPSRPTCTIMNSVGSAVVAVCAKDATRMNCEDIIPIVLEIIWRCEDQGDPWNVRGHAEFTWGSFNVYAS